MLHSTYEDNSRASSQIRNHEDKRDKGRTCAGVIYFLLQEAEADACVHQSFRRVQVRVQLVGDGDAL